MFAVEPLRPPCPDGRNDHERTADAACILTRSAIASADTHEDEDITLHTDETKSVSQQTAGCWPNTLSDDQEALARPGAANHANGRDSSPPLPSLETNDDDIESSSSITLRHSHHLFRWFAAVYEFLLNAGRAVWQGDAFMFAKPKIKKPQEASCRLAYLC